MDGIEDKYLVIKRDDINYLTDAEKKKLAELVHIINVCRAMEMKKENKYLVVNQDESYANEVWEIIQSNESKK